MYSIHFIHSFNLTLKSLLIQSQYRRFIVSYGAQDFDVIFACSMIQQIFPLRQLQQVIEDVEEELRHVITGNAAIRTQLLLQVGRVKILEQHRLTEVSVDSEEMEEEEEGSNGDLGMKRKKGGEKKTK